jgi:hypothetical protein
MKIQAAVLCSLAIGASAFSPKGFVAHKSGLMVPPSANQDDANSPLWRSPNMNMVAGGAERSYGQEYYEGASRNARCVYSFVRSFVRSLK